MDWLTLCLLLPLLIFPVVMLWGFAGCGSFDAAPTVLSPPTVFTFTLANTAEGTVTITPSVEPASNPEVVAIRIPVSSDPKESEAGRTSGPLFLPMVDSGLSELSEFFYLLRTFRPDGTVLAATATQKVRTLPATPSEVRAEASGSSTIRVTWTNHSTKANITVVRILNAAAGLQDEKELGGDVTSYEAMGLTPDTEHGFQVAARYRLNNELLTSEFTPAAPVTARTSPPVTPPTQRVTYTGLDLANIQGSSGAQNSTYIIRIPQGQLEFSSAESTRITFRGSPSGGLSLGKITISQPAAGGQLYDSASDLQVVATGVNIQTNESSRLEVAYRLDATKDLLVAFDVLAIPGADFLSVSDRDETSFFFLNGGQEADQAPQPDGTRRRSANYEVRNGSIVLIEKIEVL